MTHDVHDRMTQATIFSDVQEASDRPLDESQVPQQSPPSVADDVSEGRGDVICYAIDQMMRVLHFFVEIVAY